MVKISLHRGLDSPGGSRRYYRGASYPKRARQQLKRYSGYVARYSTPVARTVKQYSNAAVGVAAALGVSYYKGRAILNSIKAAFQSQKQPARAPAMQPFIPAEPPTPNFRNYRQRN